MGRWNRGTLLDQLLGGLLELFRGLVADFEELAHDFHNGLDKVVDSIEDSFGRAVLGEGLAQFTANHFKIFTCWKLRPAGRVDGASGERGEDGGGSTMEHTTSGFTLPRPTMSTHARSGPVPVPMPAASFSHKSTSLMGPAGAMEPASGTPGRRSPETAATTRRRPIATNILEAERRNEAAISKRTGTMASFSGSDGSLVGLKVGLESWSWSGVEKNLGG